MFKKNLFCCLFVCFMMPLFCDSWYVCLGSFKDKKNAQNFVENLKRENIHSRIYLHQSENGKFYRVLSEEKFDFIHEARRRRDEINSHAFIQKLNISGLWACGASDEDLQDDDTIILTSNDANDIPISTEKPFSVLVRSYKEEQAAINDKQRLAASDVDTYILKTFDDSSYFSFDLHAGAFDNETEVEQLQEKLADIGIEDTKISNYEDIADNIEKYNEVIKTQNVTYAHGNDSIPTSFSPWVQKCIRQFPINKNFRIEQIMLFDIDNINATNTEVPELEEIEDFLDETDNIHAASLAIYKDDLFDKSVSIFIAVGDDGTFTQKNATGEMKLAIVDDILNCNVNKDDDGNYTLFATNSTNNMYVVMHANDFTQSQFDAFINNVSNDSSLLVYPQLRKTLLVLPEKNDTLQRDFLYFNLSKVQESYAREKNYSAWSIPIVGHWEASNYFCQDGEKVSVSFFDMDYDYNASRIHGMFMDEKRRGSINENNHPSALENANSWYLDTLFSTNELSFSTKSYIIAINSYNENMLEENELIDIAEELQIWD